jgi:hydrogenase-1 operon protein HyaE
MADLPARAPAVPRPSPPEPPLVTRLVDAGGATRMDEAGFDAFAGAPGEAALFFTEDPVRFREVLDVAVILPELARAACRPFRIGVLPPPLANAKAAVYGVRRWPAIVFLRGGEWLGNIEGLRDWRDYVEAVNGLLEAPARALPPRIIPVAAAGSTCA